MLRQEESFEVYNFLTSFYTEVCESVESDVNIFASNSSKDVNSNGYHCKGPN